MTDVVPHPNAMIHWDEIACQRGHDHHETVRTTVVLGGPTGYPDLPSIPKKYARHFEMEVWDPKQYPVDGGPYCPAHDAVSATILSHGVWEPRETILALHALTTAEPGAVMVDMGAQLGWYSLLAASCGVPVFAFDADADNLATMQVSVDANGWGDLLSAHQMRIDRGVIARFPVPIALVKIDLEGAENHAINMLRRYIEMGLVDHLLIEVSPCFADYYPGLVVWLVNVGYRAYMLPPKGRPPISMVDIVAMEPYRIDTLNSYALAELVASWHQEDCFFVREEVAW